MTTEVKAPLPRPIMRLIGTKFYRNTHRAVFRLSGGRVAGRINSMPTILLTTTGRRTGEPRTVPLLYLEDEGALVIVASNSGEQSHPDWWFNIQSDPRVVVTLRDGERPMIARPATEDESRRMWPLLSSTNPVYAYYPQVVDRQIPLVYLEPAEVT